MKRILAIAAAILVVPLTVGISFAANQTVPSTKKAVIHDLPAIQNNLGLVDSGFGIQKGETGMVAANNTVVKDPKIPASVEDLPVIQEHLGVAPAWSLFPAGNNGNILSTRTRPLDFPSTQSQDGR